MTIYYIIAILAALSWAFASLISADLTREIGALVFNRIRLFFVSLMLISYTFYLNTWATINIEFVTTILISGHFNAITAIVGPPTYPSPIQHIDFTLITAFLITRMKIEFFLQVQITF